MVGLFEDANICAIHAKRVTIMPQGPPVGFEAQRGDQVRAESIPSSLSTHHKNQQNKGEKINKQNEQIKNPTNKYVILLVFDIL